MPLGARNSLEPSSPHQLGVASALDAQAAVSNFVAACKPPPAVKAALSEWSDLTNKSLAQIQEMAGERENLVRQAHKEKDRSLRWADKFGELKQEVRPQVPHARRHLARAQSKHVPCAERLAVSRTNAD